MAVAVETEYSWPEIDELKDRIANPDAYAVTAAATTTEAAPTAEAAKEEEKEEEAEESGDEGFGGLFD